MWLFFLVCFVFGVSKAVVASAASEGSPAASAASDNAPQLRESVMCTIAGHPLCIALICEAVQMMMLGIFDEGLLVENLAPYEELLVRKIRSRIF